MYPNLNFGQNSTELASYLIDHIVALDRDFVILNKPPNLSVWGQSLENIEAMKLINPHLVKESMLSIKDCLPQLAKLIDDLECNATHQSNMRFHDNGNDDRSDEKVLPKLYIVEALPSSYSGLILLARTHEYAQGAKKFYRNANLGGPFWGMYQQFVALCWGKPFHLQADVRSFPIATYALNDHISIGYRPNESESTKRLWKEGVILHKHVQHKCIDQVDDCIYLIELCMNSTFRGLPEVYLLYEGSIIIGEWLQSSRFIPTGISPIISHPSKFILNTELPMKLRQRFGGTHFDFSNISVHLHRSRLYVPIPVRRKSEQSDELLVLPHTNNKWNLTNRNQSFLRSSSLSWSIVTDFEETAKPKYLLTCYSSKLPEYFSFTMKQLGFKFDYDKWIQSQINHT